MRIVDNALETYISKLSKADRKIMEEKNGTKSIRAEFENVIKRGGGYGNIRMLKNDIENAINYKMLEWKGLLQAQDENSNCAFQYVCDNHTFDETKRNLISDQANSTKFV